MSTLPTATVRMFGALHLHRSKRGLASKAEVEIPAAGCTAEEVAKGLDLPLETIEAVFVNHLAYGLDHRVMPGDRIAFVPRGIPGPGRFLLGISQPRA